MAKKQEKEELISLRIESGLLAQLDRLAKQQDRARGYIVRKAIEHYIECNSAQNKSSR